MTQRLLSIDPGKTGAWAMFKDKKLVRAEKGDPREAIGMSLPAIVVIEAPRWYPKEREVDVNDLLDLSVLVGEYKGYYKESFFETEISLVFPRAWKGTVPWEICCERVLAELTPAEVAVLPRRPRKKDVSHDVLDAVGIGLWKLGRFG